MDFENANRQLQLVAFISCLCNLLVIITSFFPHMRTRLFMRIIVCISISIFCGNIPYLSVTRTRDDTWWCTFQGFCNLYFYPASWVWTTILMYSLYRVATKGSLPLSEWSLHVLGWGIPSVTTLLIFTTNRLGRFSSNDDNDVCTIGGGFSTAFMWHIFSYYGLFTCCLVAMLWLYVKVLRVKHLGKAAVSLQMLDLAMTSLQLYPVLMTICWIPEIVAFVVQYINDNDDLYHYALIIKLSNGFFTTCIFFIKSQHARRLWYQLLLLQKGNLNRLVSVDSLGTEGTDIFAGDFPHDASSIASQDRPLLGASFGEEVYPFINNQRNIYAHTTYPVTQYSVEEEEDNRR